MRIGIIVSSGDPETVWNALRFANFALKEGDEVQVFLLGKGVECESLDREGFRIKEELRAFVERGGRVLACGTCLRMREMEGTDLCPVSTMADLHRMVGWAERILTF